MSKRSCISIVAAIAAVLLTVSLISCTADLSGKSGVTEITELNVPYEGDSLKITATDFQIKRTKDFLFIDGSTTASVHFEAENVSDGELSFSQNNISIYTDDVLLDAGELKSSLFGDLMPGKRSVGYLEFTVPDSTAVVEIIIRENTDAESEGRYASFIFEVPAVTATASTGDDPDIKDKVDGAVSEIRDFINENDDFVTDIKDYIDGIVSDIQK